MTNPLQKIQNEAYKIRLTPQEKQAMHAQIFGVAYTPAPMLVRSSYSWFSVRLAVPALAAVVIMLSGGTAYAAQGALPGDLLYTIKTGVNEPVAGALAFSNEAKASFHTSVAEVRLKEAEALASEGKLDAATTMQLETNFEDHVAQADAITKTIGETDEGAAVEAEVRLGSSLAAHGSILARIGEGSTDEQTKENSNTIALHIQSHTAHEDGSAVTLAVAAIAPQAQSMSLTATDSSVDESVSARTMAMTKTNAVGSDVSSTTQKKIALQLQKKAQSELNDAHDSFDSAKRALAATTSAKITLQLAALDKRMQSGKAAFKLTNYESARATFTAVLKDSVELSAYITASKKFNLDFVRSWLNDDHTDEPGVQKGNDTPNATILHASTSINLESTQTQETNDAGGKGDNDKKTDDAGLHVELHL